MSKTAETIPRDTLDPDPKKTRKTMEHVGIEVPDYIAERLEGYELSAFASKAVQDRFEMYDQAIELLKEAGWDENELLWAAAAFHSYLTEGVFSPGSRPDRIAAQLEKSAELKPPQRFEVSEERSRELVEQVREHAGVAYALVFAARDFTRFGPLELQTA